MLLAFALLASSFAALPSLSADDGSRLVLAQDEQPAPPELYPPPPPLEPWQPPLAPAARQASTGLLFSEALGADFGLRLLFEGAAVFLLAESALALSPPCGGPPNDALGIPLLVLGLGTLVGQAFTVSAVVNAIFEGGGHRARYWLLVIGDLLATLVVGPALGLGLGYITSAIVGNGSSSSLTAIVGLTTFAVVGAFGAPSFALFYPEQLPAAPAPIARTAATVTLLRLAFN